MINKNFEKNRKKLMHKKTTKEDKAKFWKMQIENLIRYELGSNKSKILQRLVEEYGWNPSLSSFYTRLKKGSLTLVELSELLECCNQNQPVIYNQDGIMR